jgi:hypothetical protein
MKAMKWRKVQLDDERLLRWFAIFQHATPTP